MKYFSQELTTVKIIHTFIIIFILALLAGCQTPQEESGVSAIPFNQPAEWENSENMGSN